MVVINTESPNQTGETLELEKPAIIEDNQAYKLRLRENPEVKTLTNEIQLDNLNSILAFGQASSEGISQMSDKLLSSMKAVNSEEASRMLVQLTKIMDKFDIKELENPSESKGFINKFFKTAKDTVDKLFAKYDDMSKEVDKIYVILKQFELDSRTANDKLQEMFNANVKFFEDLEKYIVAGEIGQEEIENYKLQVLNSPEETMSSHEKSMMVQKLDMARDMLAQRTMDLQIAENVAMQTVPMLQMQQMANFNLMRKINSSFIITLPIFKQALTQAIMLKRQEIQAKSISQFDKKTNELLIRNAENAANQSVNIAKMANDSSIQIETLRKTYDAIKKGLNETQSLNEEIAMKRKQDTIELENMKAEMKSSGLLNAPAFNK